MSLRRPLPATREIPTPGDYFDRGEGAAPVFPFLREFQRIDDTEGMTPGAEKLSPGPKLVIVDLFTVGAVVPDYATFDILAMVGSNAHIAQSFVIEDGDRPGASWALANPLVGAPYLNVRFELVVPYPHFKIGFAPDSTKTTQWYWAIGICDA